MGGNTAVRKYKLLNTGMSLFRGHGKQFLQKIVKYDRIILYQDAG